MCIVVMFVVSLRLETQASEILNFSAAAGDDDAYLDCLYRTIVIWTIGPICVCSKMMSNVQHRNHRYAFLDMRRHGARVIVDDD